MDKKTYSLLENYMLSCMLDSAHDKEHIYRVLYTALDIAKTEKAVDYDVLICACLLHDIGLRYLTIQYSDHNLELHQRFLKLDLAFLYADQLHIR